MRGILRRLPWAICCALFVCLVPSSASWAVTGSPASSASGSRWATSSFGSVNEPAPVDPSPTDGPAPAPDPGPEPAPGDPAGAGEPAPEPTATETVVVTETPAPVTETVTAAPEPAPEPAMTTMGAGTAEDPMIVTLDTESMAALLVALCLTVMCLGAVTVRSFMPGGD